MKILFTYLGQLHQVMHSLPIAAELAMRPGVSVEIGAISHEHLDFCQRLLRQHAPQARIQTRLLMPGPIDRLRVGAGLGRSAWKQGWLFRHRPYFRSFDAIVTPERTSLLLKRLGIGSTKLIWTRHGAGDREIGFADDVGAFDFVLVAGRKIEQRLLDAGLIRPGAYALGIYAKFDWTRNVAAPLFGNGRPTVVYNPHFRPALSSWPRFGSLVLDQFANSNRYNLIFAPHVRLFDPPGEHLASFQRWRGLEQVRIDLGSERSLDMSYTHAADLYLGDVSSQVAEFVCRPRPCVFLNAHGVSWQGDPNYRFWAMGPVLDTPDHLLSRIDEAFADHDRYIEAQKQYVDETFDLPDEGSSAQRAADAIMGFLRRPSAS